MTLGNRLLSTMARLRLTSASGVALPAVALLLLFLATEAQGDQTQCVGGPCGPAHQLCAAPFQHAPQFHVMDATCAENDPNGPFFDEVHQMYHLFYQDHLAIAPGHGPDWGHAVSKDFVNWARLPVAIWNDQPYDRAAIFTGSTTVIDGKPVIVYPGLCIKSEYPNCTTGTLLAVAVPANPEDPLYYNWSKPSYNPIMNNTQRDPSTAWKTDAGEWRLTTYDGTIYASLDFKSWYVNGHSQFPTGECPSVFPLPEMYKGMPAPSGLPSHVHKCSFSGKDWMQVGTWVDGPPRTAGSWTQTPGYSFDPVNIDKGKFYACKDFFDSKQKRRINFGWSVVPPASTQSLPRHVTWHPTLKQLMHSPVAEMEQLRAEKLASKTAVPLKAGDMQYLGDWAATKGNQSEVVIEFARPSAEAIFGIDVVTGPQASDPRTRVYIHYVPGAANITVGTGNGPDNKTTSQFMPGIDLPGGDFNVTNVNYKDPKTCEQTCLANPKCKAYTYVVRGPLYASCCQKGTGYGYDSKSSCTSGTRAPEPIPHSGGGFSDELRMSPADATLQLRVFVDNTFLEAYWMDGRVAMTQPLLGSSPAAGMALFATKGSVTVDSVDVYHLRSIWVEPEFVLAQHAASLEA